jgi:hypothetical protein
MYFGRPGFLFEIQHPRGDATMTRLRGISAFPTAAGGVRTGRLLDGKRTMELRYEQLFYDTFYLIEAIDQGHEGPGPFALIDPARTNYLTVNQSAATSQTNATDNFTIAGSGCTIESNDTVFDRGPRALQWNFTFAASGDLTLDSPTSDWPGIPVMSGVAITFSAYAKGGGTDAIMSITACLEWLDVNGTTLSTTTGSTLVTSTSYTVFSVSGTPPASAAYVICHVKTNTGMSAGSILYLDRFQLQRGSTVTSWRPGTGVFPVEVVSFVEVWPWQATDYRKGAVLTLQEAG